jgi:hypothetical protein
MTLKFGIHKGKDISAVTDTSYLQTLLFKNTNTIQQLLDPARQDEHLGFGQWQDSKIKDIPEDYRKWLLESSQEAEHGLRQELERRNPSLKKEREHHAQVEKLEHLLKDAIARMDTAEAKLQATEAKLKTAERGMRAAEKRAEAAEKRAHEAEEKITRKPVSIADDSMISIVTHGFRQLAQRHHPDHGGSGDAMRKLIDGRDALLEAISRMSHRQSA